MNVLIVESELGLASALKASIESWSYRAEVSGGARQGMRKLRDGKFDVVLLDLGLPDSPGEDLISRMKKEQPGIGVIAMTTNSSREMELNARMQGILFYMIKPPQIENLKNILDHLSRGNVNVAIYGKES